MIFFQTILGSISRTRNYVQTLVPINVDKVFVMEMGQSNMEGRDGDINHPDYPFTSSHSIYTHQTTTYVLNTTREGAQIGSHANYFAEKFYELTGVGVMMNESAMGGTAMTNIRLDRDDWSATGERRGDTEIRVNAALSLHNISEPTIGLWCQGETDAGSHYNDPTGYTLADIKVGMQDIIDWWVGLYPNTPFLISLLGNHSTPEVDVIYQAVREIQQEIANENNNVYVAFEGANKFKEEGKLIDEVHYSYGGLKEMGESFAIKAVELLRVN